MVGWLSSLDGSAARMACFRRTAADGITAMAQGGKIGAVAGKDAFRCIRFTLFLTCSAWQWLMRIVPSYDERCTTFSGVPYGTARSMYSTVAEQDLRVRNSDESAVRRAGQDCEGG